MGNALERILREKGLSLYRLGKLTSIPYSSLHAFKSSQAKLAACSSATLFTMAKALGVPMERFFEDEKLHLPRRFAYCFWDVDIDNLTNENTCFAIARLYERGGIDGICFVERNFTEKEIVEAALTRRDFSPVTANYLAQRYDLKKEEMAYYRHGGGQDWRKVP